VVKIKSLKGFTLIELIIVMAIFSIIMSAIMTMTKPVTNLANVAIDYDTQRTVSNEINTYVCQNLKYATHAQVYTECKDLPSNSISAFKLSSGADCADIKVIAIINNFSGANITTIAVDSAPNTYNGVAKDDYGRVFMSDSVSEPNNVTYYTAMGKWYYGNNKYQFDFTCDIDAITGAWEGITTIKTTTFENGNPAVKASNSSKFLNYSSSVMSTTVDGNGVNTYIVYTKK